MTLSIPPLLRSTVKHTTSFIGPRDHIVLVKGDAGHPVGTMRYNEVFINRIKSLRVSPWLASGKQLFMTYFRCKPPIFGVCQRTIRYDSILETNNEETHQQIARFGSFTDRSYTPSPLCLDEVLLLSLAELAPTALGGRRL
jgi:hypothetical protein